MDFTALPEVCELGERIRRYVERWDPIPSHWYVGVAQNVVSALSNEHRLRPQVDLWIACKASDPVVARTVRAYCIERLGTEGLTDPTPSDAAFVYAYRKRMLSKP